MFSASQGLIGPRGLSPAMVSFWEGAAARLSQSEEWKKELEASYWEGNYRPAREALKYYEGQAIEIRDILADLGFAK